MRAPREDGLPTSERLRIVALDVTDAHSIARAVDAAGSIDALVNNAGGGLMGALEGVSMDATRQLFGLNTFGTMAMTQALLPGFRARGTGVIVNISSAVTLKPLPMLSAYTASKAAVEAFSEDLSLEVSRSASACGWSSPVARLTRRSARPPCTFTERDSRSLCRLGQAGVLSRAAAANRSHDSERRRGSGLACCNRSICAAPHSGRRGRRGARCTAP